jgi:hypothetical protein
MKLTLGIFDFALFNICFDGYELCIKKQHQLLILNLLID